MTGKRQGTAAKTGEDRSKPVPAGITKKRKGDVMQAWQQTKERPPPAGKAAVKTAPSIPAVRAAFGEQVQQQVFVHQGSEPSCGKQAYGYGLADTTFDS